MGGGLGFYLFLRQTRLKTVETLVEAFDGRTQSVASARSVVFEQRGYLFGEIFGVGLVQDSL